MYAPGAAIEWSRLPLRSRNATKDQCVARDACSRAGHKKFTLMSLSLVQPIACPLRRVDRGMHAPGAPIHHGRVLLRELLEINDLARGVAEPYRREFGNGYGEASLIGSTEVDAARIMKDYEKWPSRIHYKPSVELFPALPARHATSASAAAWQLR